MKQIVLVVAFFPLLTFCVAGVIELRSRRSGIEKLGSLIPITLGFAAFGFSFAAGWLIDITPASSVTISRVKTMASSVIACSGIFVPYSRRTSAVWIAYGSCCWRSFGCSTASWPEVAQLHRSAKRSKDLLRGFMKSVCLTTPCRVRQALSDFEVAVVQRLKYSNVGPFDLSSSDNVDSFRSSGKSPSCIVAPKGANAYGVVL
jgi:hypothetical protein